MTTIIYGCPSEDEFTPEQATLLANIYQEPEWIADDGLEMENWDDKLIITTAPKVEIHGFDEDDLISYDEAMEFIQNEPASKPQHSGSVSLDVIHTSKESGMTVTDGIDLVAMLIENDLCSDDTPEHIKADLRVLAIVIRILQSIYPFTTSPDITDIEHRKWRASEEIGELNSLLFALSVEIKAGKFHNTRQRDAANHE